MDATPFVKAPPSSAGPNSAGATRDRPRWPAVIRVVSAYQRRRQRYCSAGVENASAVSCRVPGHLTVIQRDGSTDYGHRATKRHPVSDAAAVTTSSVVVHLAVVDGEDGGVRCAGGALGVDVPPPEANRPLPAAVLPFTSDLF